MLDIQFRFLPRITFLVDHLCVMLLVVIQKILLFLNILLCYFNRSAETNFIYSALQTFVCQPAPTPSFHAARWSWKNNVRWGFIDGLNHFINASTPRLSYLFQTSTKAPFYSLCDLRLKLLQEKKLMISFAEKGLCRFWTNIAVSVR